MPQVTERIRKKWKGEHVNGDNRKISKACGISEHAIGRCIRSGKGALETIAAINSYYKIGETKRLKTDIDNVN